MYNLQNVRILVKTTFDKITKFAILKFESNSGKMTTMSRIQKYIFHHFFFPKNPLHLSIQKKIEIVSIFFQFNYKFEKNRRIHKDLVVYTVFVTGSNPTVCLTDLT